MTSCAIPSPTKGLYLDRDHPVFAGPPFRDAAGNPTLKLTRLASPGNPDAVVWSVFRTLLRLDAEGWLDALLAPLLTPGPSPLPLRGEARGEGVSIEFWPSVVPPAARLLWLLDHLDSPRVSGSRGALRQPERLDTVRRDAAAWQQRVTAAAAADGAGVLEEPVELSAVIRAPGLLAVVEASMGAPLAVQSEWDTARDRMGRTLDALLELAAGERDAQIAYLFIAPVIEKPRKPLLYDVLLPRYQDAAARAELLPHRSPAELARLDGRIGWLTWGHALQAAAGACATADDAALVRGLRDWLFWQERRAGLR